MNNSDSGSQENSKSPLGFKIVLMLSFIFFLSYLVNLLLIISGQTPSGFLSLFQPPWLPGVNIVSIPLLSYKLSSSLILSFIVLNFLIGSIGLLMKKTWGKILLIIPLFIIAVSNAIYLIALFIFFPSRLILGIIFLELLIVLIFMGYLFFSKKLKYFLR